MKFLRNLSGKLRNLPKRTQVLVTVMLGLAIIAVGVFICGYTSGAFSSSASGLFGGLPGFGNIIGSGNVGYFADLSGKVTDAKTHNAISNAKLVLKCTNNNRQYGFNGTDRNAVSGGDGMYYMDKKHANNVKTRTELKTPIPGVGKTYVYKYSMTVSAEGYKTETLSFTWPAIAQDGTIREDVALTKDNVHKECNTTKQTCEDVAGAGADKCTTDADCKTAVNQGMSGWLKVKLTSGTYSACEDTKASCTVNLTANPVGSKTWTGIHGDGNQTTPNTITWDLSPGTYSITGGNLITGSSNAAAGLRSYNIYRVNGSPVGSSFQVTAGQYTTVILEFK